MDFNAFSLEHETYGFVCVFDILVSAFKAHKTITKYCACFLLHCM